MVLLWEMIVAQGWPDIVALRFVTLAEAGLSVRSTDREVWKFAQAQQMLLLTNNRNMDDEDSLESTMREESTSTSLPVLTVGNLRRLGEHDYRRRCAERLVEIVLDLDQYRGTGLMFIP